MEDQAKIVEQLTALVKTVLATTTDKERKVHLNQLLGFFRNPHRFPLYTYAGYRDGKRDLYTVFTLETGVVIGQGVYGSFVFESIEVHTREAAQEQIAHLFRLHQKTIDTLPKRK
jgi:hypothetical protein